MKISLNLIAFNFFTLMLVLLILFLIALKSILKMCDRPKPSVIYLENWKFGYLPNLIRKHQVAKIVIKWALWNLCLSIFRYNASSLITYQQQQQLPISLLGHWKKVLLHWLIAAFSSFIHNMAIIIIKCNVVL